MKKIFTYFLLACVETLLAFYIKWPLLNIAVCCDITLRCLVQICLYFEKNEVPPSEVWEVHMNLQYQRSETLMLARQGQLACSCGFCCRTIKRIPS